MREDAEIMGILAQRTFAIRQFRGLTPEQLGEKSGITRKGAISRFERGLRQLSVGEMVRIADALDVNVAVLLGDIPMTGVKNG